MMDPAVPAFEAEVAKVKLSPPCVPIMSSATAAWLSAEEATSPAYWARQLRLPVRFADAVQALWKHRDYVALELGPRATATTLARSLSADRGRQMAVPSMADAPALEQSCLLGAFGQLWAMGATLDLGTVAQRSPPVQIPGYPFARDRHWIEAAAPQVQDAGSITALLQAQMIVLRKQVALLEQRDGARPLTQPANEECNHLRSSEVGR